MEWLDVTLPLAEAQLPTYEGDPPLVLCPRSRIEPNDADTYALTMVSMTTHTGTHVDAPAHFIADGQTVDQLLPETLCGPATVLDLRGEGLVLDERAFRDRAARLRGVTRLLLKTDNVQILHLPFQRNYAHLTPGAATYLRQEIGVALLGIDYLSVDPWPDVWPGYGFPVHRALLEGSDPVVIVEGVDLREIDEGPYELLCLPLRIAGGDGAPARVLLRR